MPAICQVPFLIIFSNYYGTFPILLWDLLYLYYPPGEDAEVLMIIVMCPSTCGCSVAEQWCESGSFCRWKETLKEIFECKQSIQEVVLGSMVRNREENQKEGKPIERIRVVASIGNWGFGGGCSPGGPPPLHMLPGLFVGWIYPCGQRKPREVCAPSSGACHRDAWDWNPCHQEWADSRVVHLSTRLQQGSSTSRI